MNKVHAGHEVVSLFQLPINQNLKVSARKRWNTLAAIVSVFFIVVLVSIFLRYSSGVFEEQASVALATQEEGTAFEPGAFIHLKTNEGYVSKK